MTFPREQILLRLVQIALTVGAKTVVRDTITVNDDQLPCIAILEGDEEADPDDPSNRPTAAPRRVHMQPHIVIAAARKVSPPVDIGPGLNEIFAALLKAIMTDATLADLTLDDRGVRYLGMESDLAVGRNMQGQMAVKFQLTYGLVPSDL
jgi:hypothetical protein